MANVEPLVKKKVNIPERKPGKEAATSSKKKEMATSSKNKFDDDLWLRCFQVIEPTKHERGYTVYKVISTLIPKNNFDGGTEIIVWKRFTEFRGLYKYLKKCHSMWHLPGEFPDFPEGRIFDRFDPHVIEQRRKAAEELLRFSGRLKPLFTCDPFLKFFDQNPKHIPNQSHREINDSQSVVSSPSLSKSTDEDDLESRPGSIFASPSVSQSSTPARSVQNLKGASEVNNESSTNSWLVNHKLPRQSTSIETSEFEAEFQKQSQKVMMKVSTPSPTPSPVRTPLLGSAIDGRPPIESCEQSNPHPETNHDLSQAMPTSLSPCRNESSDELDQYLIDAGCLISQAKELEEKQEYEGAFESYKCAVGILLQGAQKEMNEETRSAIKKKILSYLNRAETIYNAYLITDDKPNNRRNLNSPVKICAQRNIKPEYSTEELSRYHLIGVRGRILIAKHQDSGQMFAVKVVPKQANYVDDGYIVLPQKIPHMVELIKYFETEMAIVLVLQLIVRGKLWDVFYDQYSPFASRSNGEDCLECEFKIYQQSSPIDDIDPFSTDEMNPSMKKSDNRSRLKYAYSSGSQWSVDSIDSIPEDSIVDDDVDGAGLMHSYAHSLYESSSRYQTPKLYLKSAESIDSINSIESFQSCPDTFEKPSSKAAKTSKQDVLGISSLLSKAKNLIKNVDETLRSTKHLVAKHMSESFESHQKNEREVSRRENYSFDKPSTLEKDSFLQLRKDEMAFGPDGDIKEEEQISEEQRKKESKVKQWVLQAIEGLQALHAEGILYRDLQMDDILIDDHDNLVLRYKFEGPRQELSGSAVEGLFCAPELLTQKRASQVSDWWSLGVIAYQLLTSQPLASVYPSGISTHTKLAFPKDLSLEAKDFLLKVLTVAPSERLGRHGAHELLWHPFMAEAAPNHDS